MLSKRAVLKLFEEWLPLLIPGVLLVGRLLIAFQAGRYGITQVPSDLCYYGATVYIWALTNHLSGSRFSLSYVDSEGPYITILLVVNLIFYFVFFPPLGCVSKTWLGIALFISFALGPISTIYLRARI